MNCGDRLKTANVDVIVIANILRYKYWYRIDRLTINYSIDLKN